MQNDHADQSCTSDSIVDIFCSGLQVCIRLFTLSSQGHCKLLYSSIAITLIIGSLQSVLIFLVKISIQYISRGGGTRDNLGGSK